MPGKTGLASARKGEVENARALFHIVRGGIYVHTPALFPRAAGLEEFGRAALAALLALAIPAAEAASDEVEGCAAQGPDEPGGAAVAATRLRGVRADRRLEANALLHQPSIFPMARHVAPMVDMSCARCASCNAVRAVRTVVLGRTVRMDGVCGMSLTGAGCSAVELRSRSPPGRSW